MFSLPLAWRVGFVAIIFIFALWVSLRRAQNLQSRLSAANHYPAACLPKPGEMARVRFIRGDDRSSFMHVGNSVLTIEMMRGCSAPP
jgi:hypothetical protein